MVPCFFLYKNSKEGGGVGGEGGEEEVGGTETEGDGKGVGGTANVGVGGRKLFPKIAFWGEGEDEKKRIKKKKEDLTFRFDGLQNLFIKINRKRRRRRRGVGGKKNKPPQCPNTLGNCCLISRWERM